MSCGGQQETLFDWGPNRPEVPMPDLASYDLILVNTSAGKDSQAMMDEVVQLADMAGCTDRLVAVHCDLRRVEWTGTVELAAEHAAHYGLPFEVVRNRNWADLLERIEARGQWPDAQNRYCTSEFKTGQVRRLATALVALWRARTGETRPCRILNALGIRAAESPARAKKDPFHHHDEGKGWSNGRRSVDEWYPIFYWSLEDVWARNKLAGTRHHAAYDASMPRLSCCFCVLASKPSLVVSARLNPELAADYAAAEERMGHQFKRDLSMAEIVRLAASDDVFVPTNWEG